MALAAPPALRTCGGRSGPNQCRRVVDAKAEVPPNRL